MKRYTPAIVAVLIGLGIRISMLLGGQGIALEGYETVLHLQHIAETGLPLIQNSYTLESVRVAAMPLFYYLLAFLDIFLPTQYVLLVVPNLLISLLPIPVWMLSKQIARNEAAATTITLASVFIPTLYQETLRTASPLTLALPLLLLSYYYFLRLEKTPRDQKAFAVTAIALTLTSPLSMLLAAAMGLTLLFKHIQKTRFSIAMAEATIFFGLLAIWANSIVYKHVLQDIRPESWFSYAGSMNALPALIGIIPLIAGMWGAYHTFTSERGVGAHAIVALGIIFTITTVTGTIQQALGALLIGTAVILLSTISIDSLMKARKRSRVSGVHTTFLAVMMIAFLLTSAVPSIALGAQENTESDLQAELEVLQALQGNQKQNILWDEQHQALLHTYEYTTNDPRLWDVLPDISEIRLIQALNDASVDIIIVPEGHGLPIQERCFEPLHKATYEVYNIRCVVQ